MKPWHVAVVLAAGAGGWLAWQQWGPSSGFNQPPAQASPDDDLARLTGSGAPYCHPEQHHHGYVYTPHRFPRTCGGEITAVIHRGFSPMRVPMSQDVQWLIAPPSEVMF
jgi:hypothetical protein